MIIKNNEELLRVKCENVDLTEVDALISTLENELNNANKFGIGGIGLAAPQIGLAKNIAIIRLKNFNFNLINCKIEKGYDTAIFRQEGCLSFPGRIEDTIRYQEIYITNNLVYPHNFIATGLLSVVCQHEIDHLNGVLFMDNVVKQIISNNIKNNKIRPNDLCLCNSGKKYKKCCFKLI